MKSLLSMLLLCMSSTLLADQTTSRPSSTPPPAYPEGVSSQPRGTITPPVAPKVQNGIDLVIDAAFTWWKPQVDGMDFATVNGKVKSPPENFEPGFKVGVGMDLGYDGWDAYAEYTWVYQNWLSSSFTANSGSYGGFVAPNSTSGDLRVPVLTSGKSSRKVQFNVLDLEFGRDFFISKQLSLRPHFGAKMARMFEKTKVTENGSGTVTLADLYLRQTLSALGTRAGLDSVWRLTRNFGLYGDIAVTALWGSFHNKANNTITEDAVSDTRYNRNVSITITPVLELGVGATYMLWFNNDACLFFAKAGWEEQIWINYNHNAINGTWNTLGNLTLQGLTLKVGLAF